MKSDENCICCFLGLKYSSTLPLTSSIFSSSQTHRSFHSWFLLVLQVHASCCSKNCLLSPQFPLLIAHPLCLSEAAHIKIKLYSCLSPQLPAEYRHGILFLSACKYRAVVQTKHLNNEWMLYPNIKEMQIYYHEVWKRYHFILLKTHEDMLQWCRL